MALEIVSVQDVGGDRLLVTATDGTRTLTAVGHVSATQRHYDADAYAEMWSDEHGGWKPVTAKTPKDTIRDVHLKANASPRPMTPAEVTEYAHRLLAEQHGTAVESTPISFE